MKIKMNKDDALYRLKEYYQILIYLLKTQFESGEFIVVASPILNKSYLHLCILIEDLLGYIKNEFSKDSELIKLVNDYLRPVENLEGSISEESGDVWEQDIRPRVVKFASQVEEIYIKNGEPKVSLSSQEVIILKKALEACEDYRLTIKNEDQKFIKETGVQAKKFNEASSNNFPKLTINLRTGEFRFTSKEGKETTAQFRRDTTEYNLITHLAANPKTPYLSGELVACLKTLRQHADSSSPKDRVKDAIKAIKRKLGSESITTTPSGYMLDCEVTRT